MMQGSSETAQYRNTLDELVAPGLRLWMLLAMILGVLLFMVVVVCCFMRIRIPRTKREIELMTARRRLRRQRGALPAQRVADDKAVIVMQSLGVPRLTPSDATSCGGDSCHSLELASSCAASAHDSEAAPPADARRRPQDTSV